MEHLPSAAGGEPQYPRGLIDGVGLILHKSILPLPEGVALVREALRASDEGIPCSFAHRAQDGRSWPSLTRFPQVRRQRRSEAILERLGEIETPADPVNNTTWAGASRRGTPILTLPDTRRTR